MAKQLKKRPIEKELKFLADFELYGVLSLTFNSAWPRARAPPMNGGPRSTT